MKIEISSVEELDNVAKEWLKLHPKPEICLLNGEMGTGKTTFIKTICKHLGVKDTISSPTFSIVNEYSTEKGESIFHFDLYRLNDEHELFDIGFEEYLSRKASVFIEWPELGSSFYPEEISEIKILQKGSKRIFTFS